MIVLLLAFRAQSSDHRRTGAEPSRWLHYWHRCSGFIRYGHAILALVSNRRVDSVLVRESFDAPFSPTRGTLRVLVEEVLASGQLPLVKHNTELQVPTGFPESSPDVLDLHSLMVPSTQDTEVRARGGTDQPVRVIFLAGASSQFAMLFQVEVPTSSLGMCC